ncbi:MAG: hypothetical protein MZU97_13705 [Bacillus subtilis]|nr:hypothetical protein [Bacillus subtilis]
MNSSIIRRTTCIYHVRGHRTRRNQAEAPRQPGRRRHHQPRQPRRGHRASPTFQVKTNLQGKYPGAIDNWCRKYDAYFLNLRPEKSIIFMNRKQLDGHDQGRVFDPRRRSAKSLNQTEVARHRVGRHRLRTTSAARPTRRTRRRSLEAGARHEAATRSSSIIENEALKFFGGKSNTDREAHEDHRADQLAHHRRSDRKAADNLHHAAQVHRHRRLRRFHRHCSTWRSLRARYARIMLDFDSDRPNLRQGHQHAQPRVHQAAGIHHRVPTTRSTTSSPNDLLIVVDHHSADAVDRAETVRKDEEHRHRRPSPPHRQRCLPTSA